jgi:hypothetical protein
MVDKSHTISFIEDWLEVLHIVNKGSNLNTLDKYYIYAGGGNIDNDKNTINNKHQQHLKYWCNMVSHVERHSPRPPPPPYCTLECTQLYQSPPENQLIHTGYKNQLRKSKYLHQ